MNQNKDHTLYRLKRMQALYNTVPNLVWSLLNLIPVCIFCYHLLNGKLLYTFLGISFLPAFFPQSFFDTIQLGKTISIYKKLGVPFINRVSQNGDIINRMIRKKYPAYKVVNLQSSSVNKLLQQTYLFEKFHFIVFIFFCLVTVYAIIKNYFGWAVIISITNLAYNVYPNLLQQYIRLKVRMYAKRIRLNG